MRWGGCAEDVCFRNKAMAAFVGMGKVLPIWRGGGLGSDMFRDFAAQLVPGEGINKGHQGELQGVHRASQ